MISVIEKVFKVEKLSTFFFICVVIIFIWMCVAIPLFLFFVANEDSGRLGDTFGIINSIFSALAFGGLFYTILIQKKELAETRAEFRQQNETATRQRFENTFFNLLTFHQNLLSTIEYSDTGTMKNGRGIFDLLINKLGSKLKPVKVRTEPSEKAVDIVFMRNLYYSETRVYRSQIKLYLESLTTILKVTADTTSVKPEQKNLYYAIVRSYMGRSERTFLFYFLCLANDDDNERNTLLEIEESSHFLLNSEGSMFDESHLGLMTKWSGAIIKNIP